VYHGRSECETECTGYHGYQLPSCVLGAYWYGKQLTTNFYGNQDGSRMPKIAILNMIIGFAVLFVAAAAGAFIANDLTEAFLKDRELLNNWNAVLTRSAHGHTNLFAMLHIIFGLTIPYSELSIKIKKVQTAGLFLGTFAMGPLMVTRSTLPPSEGFDPLASVIGIFLSCSLAMLISHAYGLTCKLLR